ncbi:MAG: gliding motility-associated C-terminal domain-containing protein [Bacteroidia bacterium]|nr:gliding motility-associated C-terminal domain-containing protein [Bacteroidia bacterium]
MMTTLRIIINFLLIAMAMIIALPSNAQNNVYAWPDTTICQGSTVTLNVSSVPPLVATSTQTITPINDDQWSAVVNLPFPFTFYGNVYNQCIIGSNGGLGFNVANASAYNTWPINAAMPSATPADMRNTIMAPWQDNFPPGGGSIRVGTFGVAPNRVFVAEWDNVAMYSCTQTCIGNQIQLFETTNIIEIHIAAKNLCPNWNQGRAIEGLQNATGTIAHIVPGRNCCVQWSAFSDGYRFTPAAAPTYYTLSPITFVPIIFVASTNITITWFSNGNPVGSGPTLNVTPATTTSYIAQVSYTSCGNYSFRDTVTVTVSPAFNLNINPIVNVACFGDSTGSLTAVPSGAGPYSYQWSTVPSQTAVTANNLSANTYTVTVTDLLGCIVTASATVTEPPDLVITTNPPFDVLCNGQASGSVSVGVAGGVAPYSYLWSNGSSNNPNTNLIANIYTVTVTDANGCSKTASITVSEPPLLTIAPSASQTICIGTPVNLLSNANGGTPAYSYSWSDGSLTPNINVSPTTSTIYIVTVTDANGCSVTSPSIVITVNPPLTVIATGNATICNGTGIFVSAVGSGGDGNYTYTWTPNIGSGPGPFPDSPSATTTYTVTLTDGCTTPSSSSSVLVTVNPMPVVSFTGSNISGCVPLNSCFTDQSSVASGTINQWLWDFGDFSSQGTAQNPCHSYINSSSPNQYTVTLTVTTNAGCSQSFTMPNYVDAHPVTVASFVAIPKFTTIADPQITFDDNSTGASSWLWTFGDSFTDTIQNPYHIYDAVGSYQVCLYTSNIYSCRDTLCDSVTVRPDFSFYVPNAFTPNGDFVNEFFTPMGRSFKEYDLTIYDRWGEVIFRSKDIAFSWDGKLSNGKDALPGVYVYTITLRDLTNVKHSFVGNVALIR